MRCAVTLKLWPPSSPQLLAPEASLKVIVPATPLIVPVPPKGMHGCWLESPVPRPLIDPAPMSVPLPVPCAVMVAVSPSTLVDAWPW
jgi:hypothetical protein